VLLFNCGHARKWFVGTAHYGRDSLRIRQGTLEH
jgi:hypothetical protein